MNTYNQTFLLLTSFFLTLLILCFAMIRYFLSTLHKEMNVLTGQVNTLCGKVDASGLVVKGYANQVAKSNPCIQP